MSTISIEAKDEFVSTATRLRMAGRMEGKKQIVISMLQENMDESLILKVTQLNQQELNTIKLSLSEFNK